MVVVVYSSTCRRRRRCRSGSRSASRSVVALVFVVISIGVAVVVAVVVVAPPALLLYAIAFPAASTPPLAAVLLLLLIPVLVLPLLLLLLLLLLLALLLLSLARAQDPKYCRTAVPNYNPVPHLVFASAAQSDPQFSLSGYSRGRPHQATRHGSKLAASLGFRGFETEMKVVRGGVALAQPCLDCQHFCQEWIRRCMQYSFQSTAVRPASLRWLDCERKESSSLLSLMIVVILAFISIIPLVGGSSFINDHQTATAQNELCHRLAALSPATTNTLKRSP